MEIYDANTCFGFYPYEDRDTTLVRLQSVLGANEIAKACTFSMRGMYYDCIEGNEETLQACAGSQTLIPVGTIDPRKIYDYEAEIDKNVSRGIRIFRMFPEVQGWSVEQIAFQKILRILNSYRIPLIINESPTKFYHIPESITIPIVFVAAHYYQLHEFLSVLEDRANFYLETRYLLSPDAIEFFVEKIGAARLVFGSNAPVDYIGGSIRRIACGNLSERDKERIFGGNLKRILEGWQI